MTMPHHLAAARLIAGHRQNYTHEPTNAVRPIAQAASRILSIDQRVTVMKMLAHGVDHGLADDPLRRPLADHVRQAVLADTHDPLQQRLEACILLALGRTVFHRRPGPLRQGPACAAVRPVSPAQFGLHLRPSILAPMLAELHLPGLRTVRHQRHVELTLAGDEHVASVSLAATARRQWNASARYAAILTGAVWPPQAEHGVSTPAQPLDPALAALCSALLRRLGVVGSTSWLVVDIGGPVISMTWAGGRLADEVAAYLAHPLGGLPARISTDPSESDDVVTLVVNAPDDANSLIVLLRRLPADAPAPSRRPGTDAAWKAYDDVLTRPASPATCGDVRPGL
jgi:hypothetical protein